ncbi:MAG: hypothetical protein GXC72_00395 [Chitinophagaceae bacterium]|jgi:regulator of replication initiation timing|nr:hypothetical protein [Chitinophagaceae bacterium]
MVDLSQHIKNLQDKLQLLIRNQQQLQRDNQRLQKELDRVQAVLVEKDALVQQVQQQLDARQLGANGQGQSAEEKAKLEKRIDAYLKEIDKCLNLLNQ